MRNSTRTEQRLLREVAHFLLPLLCCEFCGKPLLDPKLADKVFGNKAHTPMPKTLKLTVHHRNGKHRDNSRTKTLWDLCGKSPALTKDNLRLANLSNNGLAFAICGNTSLCHSECHRRHEMSLSHREGSFKPKSLFEKACELLDKLKPSHSIYSDVECNFIFKMHQKQMRIENGKLKKQFTRYEIRRLKKLAAKGAKPKISSMTEIASAIRKVSKK